MYCDGIDTCGCAAFNADLVLDFSPQPPESLQESFVFGFDGGTSLYIFERHVEFSKLLQSLAAPVQGFNVSRININGCIK